MKTPAEARKTWCPFARVVALGPTPDIQTAAFNRTHSEDADTSNPSQCRCIAEECSQWTWADEPTQVLARDDPHRRGFCGRNVAMAMKVFGK